MRTIAVINQKGGCGKTTTAINLAGVFASRGLRTLLVDVDPQSHCAAGLAIPEQRIDLDIGDAMLEPGEFETARLLWRVKRNLDLAPSRMKLAGLEASRGGLADRANKDRALAGVLGRLAPGYDACCIDCPPGIGLLTYNALVAADTVLIPVETSYFSLRGAAKQIDTIKSLARRLGIQTPYWLMATIHDESSALARDLLAELRREFESRVCPVVIRFDGSLKEASSFGQSIMDYAPESPGAADYSALADWWLAQPARTRSDAAPAPDSDPPVVHVTPAARPTMLEVRSAATPVQGGIPLPPQHAPLHSDPVEASGSVSAASSATPSHAGSPLNSGAVSVTRLHPPGLPLEPAEHRPQPSPLEPIQGEHASSPTSGASVGDAGGATGHTIEIVPTPTVIVEVERAVSRTEDLVRRALLLNQRGSTANAGLESGMAVPEIGRGGLAAHPRLAPVELIASDELQTPGPEVPGPIARLLGVRQTARGVLFVQPLSVGRSVAIAGDFNNWSPAGHEMRANKGLGVYELLVPVPPGVYSYRLVIDGVWKPDPFNPATQPNPYGELNSVLRVAGEAGRAGRSK